jgi:hypothetical protein
VFLTSDAVFGVKSSLVVKPELVNTDSEAKKWGFPKAPFHHVKRDFILITDGEAEAERARLAAS